MYFKTALGDFIYLFSRILILVLIMIISIGTVTFLGVLLSPITVGSSMWFFAPLYIAEFIIIIITISLDIYGINKRIQKKKLDKFSSDTTSKIVYEELFGKFGGQILSYFVTDNRMKLMNSLSY